MRLTIELDTGERDLLSWGGSAWILSVPSGGVGLEQIEFLSQPEFNRRVYQQALNHR
jgi:hypothetical protein